MIDQIDKILFIHGEMEGERDRGPRRARESEAKLKKRRPKERHQEGERSGYGERPAI
jgi:hypothetical protein